MVGEIVRARRYAEPLAVVMFDIDHFKAVNDRHGHLVGDQVLIELALRLRGHLRTRVPARRVATPHQVLSARK